MTKIKAMCDQILEELCDAKEYAEKYIESKSENNSSNATKYKEMANDELKHSDYLHSMAVDMIDRLRQVYEPPVEMQKAWDMLHKEYVEKAAWVKTMLTL